ncbi:uncharacterized protein LOC129716953 [Wyeomyia smithii]|uniref:uncharacterized protein LOC129716953 n=1 Tax=Wyeomyia smithii TaxID=174621 RepID=UPI002467D93D|nr:uncharacterized protein LOC129716953 [Wyeomyia smithii]
MSTNEELLAHIQALTANQSSLIETINALKQKADDPFVQFKTPDPIKNLTTFSGNKRETQAWLEDVESQPIYPQFVRAVKTKIIGEAKEIIIASGNPNSWEDIKDALLNSYGDRRDLISHIQSLFYAKKDPTNTKFTYADEQIKYNREDVEVTDEFLNAYERTALKNILNHYSDIIYAEEQKLSFTHSIKHKIRTIDDMSIHTKSYRYPQIYEEEVQNQVQKLLRDGIISESISPYTSPIWIVPKKADASGTKEIRLVIDYRKLNEKTISDRYPIPEITEILDKLGKAIYFSTIDLVSGFHQIQLDENDREKTAFSNNGGKYEFTRMPFGLKMRPQHFKGKEKFCFKICYAYSFLFYLQVLAIARYQRHRIASAILEVTLSAQLTITHHRNPFGSSNFNLVSQPPGSQKLYTNSPMSNIFQLVGSILIVYCPYYICILWTNIINALCGDQGLYTGLSGFGKIEMKIPKIILQISVILLTLSPSVNAFFYGIRNKNIKKSFYNIWRKQKSKLAIQYEIQARTPSTCGSRRPSISGTTSSQPLLQEQLSGTFLEISKTNIDNPQTTCNVRSELSWSSNCRSSSYSVVNYSPEDLKYLTVGTRNTSVPKFDRLPSNFTQLSQKIGRLSMITCHQRRIVRRYSPFGSKPKITIVKTISEEKQISFDHEYAPGNVKTVQTKSDTKPSQFSELNTIRPTSFRKYSSLQGMILTGSSTLESDV